MKQGDFTGNETLLTTYAATLGTNGSSEKYSDRLTKARGSALYEHKKNTGVFSNDYLKWLKDKGFVANPPPKASATGTPSGVNPQTGDNPGAGIYAQNVPTEATGGQLGSLNDIGNLSSKAQDDLSSMSDMSELMSMRLQLLMDRRSKFLETISNVLKKVSSTADEIVANIK